MITASDFDASAITVGEIVADDIRTAEVFKQTGIDFCCNGKRTLAAACQQAEVAVETVLDALHQLQTTERLPTERFDEWNLDFLADYILNVHHGYLYKNLPLLEELAIKVSTKHGDRYPGLKVVRQLVEELKADLLAHLHKEEIALFPFIKQSVAARRSPESMSDVQLLSLKAPIDCMEHEHDSAGVLLYQLKELTNNYIPPVDACNSHRLLLSKLAELETDLMQHIHLENNILFPKALALEANQL
ncbi:iron-sulfur cluster repair di-iron protein [Spirosoma fluminis]